MASGNSVTVIGNLTKDPELRFTKSGTPVVGFSIAVNENKKVDGEWEEHVAFFDVTAWQDMATNIEASLSKGNRVVVLGKLNNRNWEDEDGVKHYRTEIVADEVCPSLRWATADITRVKKDSDGGSSKGSGKPAARKSDPDEDPF